MKITVETDDKKKTVFQNVTDAYICVRQVGTFKATNGDIISGIETKSWSWGGNLRELIKEITESVFDLRSVMDSVKKEKK